jgi:hypothetical protein
MEEFLFAVAAEIVESLDRRDAANDLDTWLHEW